MTEKSTFRRVPAAANILPESPCWHGPTNQLFWIDHATKILQSFGFPEETPEALPLKTKGNLRFVKSGDEDTLIIGSERGLYRFQISTQKLTILTDTLPLDVTTCINDGDVGPDGTVVIAVSDIKEAEPLGGFYILDSTGWMCIWDQVIVANGPAFSSDGNTLFLSDTFGQ